MDNAAIRRTHGERIRNARHAAGLSLGGLADAIKATGTTVTPQAISLWENGDATPRPAMQVIVASVLGHTHAELFALDDEAVA